MDALRKLVGFKTSPSPPTYPDDEVIPVYFYDSSTALRDLVVVTPFVFYDALNAQQLRDGLVQLASMRDKGWHKLGGRLRQRPGTGSNRGYNFHVPKQFTADRPAINFTHNSDFVATSIDEHPVAARLPQATTAPSVQADPAIFHDLCVPSTAPHTLEEYLTSDKAAISLHVVSFKDATIVTLIWTHMLFDVSGLEYIGKAWSSCLANRPDEVPHVLGREKDVMMEFGDPAANTKIYLQDKVLDGWKFGLWVTRFISDHLWQPRSQGITVFLPRHALIQLRARVETQLSDDDTEVPFLSDGDIVCGFATSIVASHLPRDSNRTVLALAPFDVRTRLGNLFPDTSNSSAGGFYMQNAVLATHTLLRARDVHFPENLLLPKSGETIASKNAISSTSPEAGSQAVEAIANAAKGFRRSITTQTTIGNMEAFAAMARRRADGMGPICGDSSNYMLAITNWTKARLYENYDLSPAIIKASVTESAAAAAAGEPDMVEDSSSSGPNHQRQRRGRLPGKPILITVLSATAPTIQTRVSWIVCGDAQGDYWIAGNVSKTGLETVREAVEWLGTLT